MTDKGKAEEIITFINAHFELDIRKRRRDRRYCTPRYIACKMLKSKTTLTLKEIAKLVGYKTDHSLVLRAMEKLKEQSKIYDSVKDLIEEVELEFEKT